MDDEKPPPMKHDDPPPMVPRGNGCVCRDCGMPRNCAVMIEADHRMLCPKCYAKRK
jgi:hypothetical protein